SCVGRAGDNGPGSSIPMLDQGLAWESGVSLLADCVNIIRGDGLDAIKLIAVHACVDRVNHRPLRSVPMLGECVPKSIRVLLTADSRHIGVRERGDAVENILLGARARARNHRPDGAIEMLDQRLLLELAVHKIAYGPG